MLSFLPWAVMAFGSVTSGALVDRILQAGVPTKLVRQVVQSISFLIPMLALVLLGSKGAEVSTTTAVICFVVTLGVRLRHWDFVYSRITLVTNQSVIGSKLCSNPFRGSDVPVAILNNHHVLRVGEFSWPSWIHSEHVGHCSTSCRQSFWFVQHCRFICRHSGRVCCRVCCASHRIICASILPHRWPVFGRYHLLQLTGVH